MRTLLTLILLSCSLLLPAQETNTVSTGLGSNVDALAGFLSKGSNWMIAPYGIAYNSANHTKFGGGIGIGYRVSDYVVPTMRVDFLERQFYMPSGSLQLQMPIQLGKFTIIPLAFSGIATPIGGHQEGNGSVVGIFGAGAAVRLGKHLDLIADMEKWTTFQGNQYRFGVVWKF